MLPKEMWFAISGYLQWQDLLGCSSASRIFSGIVNQRCKKLLADEFCVKAEKHYDRPREIYGRLKRWEAIPFTLRWRQPTKAVALKWKDMTVVARPVSEQGKSLVVFETAQERVRAFQCHSLSLGWVQNWKGGEPAFVSVPAWEKRIDFRVGEELVSWTLEETVTAVTALGEMLFLGKESGYIEIYAREKGIRSLSGHKGAVTALKACVVQGSPVLFSGDSEGNIRITELRYWCCARVLNVGKWVSMLRFANWRLQVFTEESEERLPMPDLSLSKYPWGADLENPQGESCSLSNISPRMEVVNRIF